MKEDWLAKRLGRMAIPREDEVARERALERALIALKNSATNCVQGAEFRHWRWGIPWLAVGLVMVFAVIWWGGLSTTGGAKTADMSVLNQMASLFPDKLEAVVEHNGKVDVQLADGEVAPSQQPLMLVLKRGQEVMRILSYSGREVCLNLNGRKTCVEVLAQNNGEVLVTGESFLWSREHPLPLDGYQIEANALSSQL